MEFVNALVGDGVLFSLVNEKGNVVEILLDVIGELVVKNSVSNLVESGNHNF